MHVWHVEQLANSEHVGFQWPGIMWGFERIKDLGHPKTEAPFKHVQTPCEHVRHGRVKPLSGLLADAPQSHCKADAPTATPAACETWMHDPGEAKDNKTSEEQRP